MRGALIAALVALLVPLAAAAQDAPAPPAPPAPPPATPTPGSEGPTDMDAPAPIPPRGVAEPEGAPPVAPEEKKRGDGSGHPDQLRFGGRVFVRDTLTGLAIGDDTRWSEDRTIDSGRVFADFRPNPKLRMVLEVDFAGGQAELKDTFLRYRPVKAFGVIAGRFKRPVSFIGLESAWSLPRIDRGLLSELRIDGARRLPFAGGRSDGVALEVAPKVALRPQVTLALLESDVAEDALLDVSESLRDDVYGRVEIEPIADLHLAVAAGWVGALAESAVVDSYEHRAFGSLEGFYDGAALRVWLEAMAGRNPVVYVGAGDDQRLRGSFRAARGIVAPRLEQVGPLRALEPFAAFAWYEPSTVAEDDTTTELTAGVALAISRHLRLQLEGGRRLVDDAALYTTDATLVRVQLGAAFQGQTELTR